VLTWAADAKSLTWHWWASLCTQRRVNAMEEQLLAAKRQAQMIFKRVLGPANDKPEVNTALREMSMVGDALANAQQKARDMGAQARFGRGIAEWHQAGLTRIMEKTLSMHGLYMAAPVPERIIRPSSRSPSPERPQSSAGRQAPRPLITPTRERSPPLIEREMAHSGRCRASHCDQPSASAVGPAAQPLDRTIVPRSPPKSFEELDVNNDGVIDRNEFIAWARRAASPDKGLAGFSPPQGRAGHKARYL